MKQIQQQLNRVSDLISELRRQLSDITSETLDVYLQESAEQGDNAEGLVSLLTSVDKAYDAVAVADTEISNILPL